MGSLFKEFNKSNISDDRKTLEAKIDEKTKEFTKNGDQEGLNDYLLNIFPLLQDYYDEEKEESTKSNSTEKFYMGDFVKAEKTSKKGKIYKTYMSKIEEKGNFDVDSQRINDVCPDCNEPFSSNFTDSTLVCTLCGYCVHILMGEEACSTVAQSTLERVEFTPYYAYKRGNHFNEWLSQFQAKQTTSIPEEIFEKIILELKKERITDPSDVTPQKIKGYLKKLKYNKFYEHIPYIITRIQGKSAPNLTTELEEKLRIMFQMIQEPFTKHCPKDRKNFLSYSYTLHKFCELLGKDELLICFPLLKSREKLHVQDVIWKGICKDLGWEYYPSI